MASSSEVDRERLRDTFDHAAALYHRARPEYPRALFDALIEDTRIRPGDKLLEVGAASGKATLPLLLSGFRVCCLEPGAALAHEARSNLRGLPVEVVETRFEEWVKPPDRRLRLVFAATSWHWVDPRVRYRLAWDALEPGGHLAFWSATHVFPDAADPFFREIQPVYEEIGAGMPPGHAWPKPGELPDSRREIAGSGLFATVAVREFHWRVLYTAEQYIALLETFSGHIAMAPDARRHLYDEMRRRIGGRQNPRVMRDWGAALHVARRLG